jgi:hypothetical protein
MKIPEVRATYMSSKRIKTMTAAGALLVIGGMSMAPAFGEDHGNREGQLQHGANDGYRHTHDNPEQHRMDNSYRQDQRHPWDHRNRHAYEHLKNDHRRNDYYGDDYGNRDYVYAPPPVVYAPAPAPGVNLFIPLEFR